MRWPLLNAGVDYLGIAAYYAAKADCAPGEKPSGVSIQPGSGWCILRQVGDLGRVHKRQCVMHHPERGKWAKAVSATVSIAKQKRKASAVMGK